MPQAGRSRSPSLLGTVKGVFDSEGVPGLYKGLSAQLLKTVLVAALIQMARAQNHITRPSKEIIK